MAAGRFKIQINQLKRMADDNNDDKEKDVNDYGIGPLRPTEEEIEEYLESVSFEWCETIRAAGSVYRDTQSVEETADEIGIPIEKAKEAIATYVYIFTYEGDDDANVSIILGEEWGLRFFRNPEVKPEEILDDVGFGEPETVEEVREKIRIFVASLMEDVDLADVDIEQDIPQTPTRPLPSIRLMEQMEQLSEQIRVATASPLFRVIDQLQREWQQMWQETLQSVTQPVLRAVQEIDFEAIQEQQRIRTALEDGIHGFDEPGSYDPQTTTISGETKSVGKAALGNFISDIQDSNVSELDDYVARLQYGLDRYEEDDYIASTLVFLSVQDGFLDIILDQSGNSPSSGHFTYDDRESAFEDEFPGIFGIGASTVASQWRDFLVHRHKIMHGDPDAYLDENIASVALIFLVLAIYTALVVLEVN